MQGKTKMNEKGFNLFTPLVGTAVIITSILISITMVYNSMNISEGVSKGYTSSQQAVHSQIVETSTSVSMIVFSEGGPTKGLGHVFSGGDGGIGSIKCQHDESPQTCLGRTKEQIEGNFGLMAYLEGHGFFGAIENRLKALGFQIDMYRPCDETVDAINIDVNDPWDPEQCVKEVGDNIGDAMEDEDADTNLFDVNYDIDDEVLYVHSRLRELMYEAEVEEAFHFELTHELENITISQITIPRDVTYISSKIGIPIEITIDKFQGIHQELDEGCSIQPEDNDCAPNQNYTTLNDGTNVCCPEEDPTTLVDCGDIKSRMVSRFNTDSDEEEDGLKPINEDEVSLKYTLASPEYDAEGEEKEMNARLEVYWETVEADGLELEYETRDFDIGNAEWDSESC